MAVRTLNFHIFAVNLQFGILILADVAANLFCFLLGLSFVAGALIPISFYLPSTFWMRHHPMSVSFRHGISLQKLTYRKENIKSLISNVCRSHRNPISEIWNESLFILLKTDKACFYRASINQQYGE